MVLAGRTGSAFAAEIGTMKVNEELDALTTMGHRSGHQPGDCRDVAVMLVMPVITWCWKWPGWSGMTTVMRAFGFPVVAIVGR